MRRTVLVLLAIVALLPGRSSALDVLVNQVGFEPDSPKVFRVQRSTDHPENGTFSVRRVSDNASVYTGTLTRKGALWDRFYWEGEFGSLRDQGDYYVTATVATESADSYGFTIAPGVLLNQTGTLVHQYFYTQRCGVSVTGWHPACHLDDGIRSDTSQHIDAAGGWHDAGDYNKFPHGFAGDGVFALLWLYDNNRSHYDAIDSDANSIPDIIDEALHQARWLAKMVDTSGHVLQQTRMHRSGASWVKPQNDTDNVSGTSDDRWIDPGSENTPQETVVCAALARTHRILASKGLPTENFAAKALSIWNHKVAIAESEGGHNNLGSAAHQIFAGLDLHAVYGQQNCWDRAVWRIQELADTTNANPAFYDSMNFVEAPGYELGVLAWFARTYPSDSRAGAARSAVQALMANNISLADDPIGLIRRNDGGSLQYFPTNPDWNGFYLGINRLYLLLTWGALESYKLIGDPSYLRFAADQYNWVMGANYNRVCQMEAAGDFNLPRYHTRLDTLSGHSSGKQPGCVPNGYIRVYSTGLPSIDLSTNRYQTNEGWLINNAAYAMAISEIGVLTDLTAPAQVASLTACPGDGQITLSWQNPSDPDFAGTMIRSKTTGYPTGPDDGTLAADVAGSPGATGSHIHTGLTNSTTCYYAAFAYDTRRNYAAAATVSAAPSLRVVLRSFTFNSGADGWNMATWQSGPYDPGTMTWNVGAMRCTGSGLSDNNDRSTREGGEIYKVISTAGFRSIRVAYDLRVNSLGAAFTGAGVGGSAVDHNDIQEQLTVFYSTDGGASWLEVAPWVGRDALLSYQSYGTRTFDLSCVSGADDNPGFALKLRWQLNTSGDTADLDNIIVTGHPNDVTPPGPVTNLAAVAGDGQITLSWRNPADADVVGTMIRAGTAGYPTSPTDGVLVADRAASPGSGDTCVHGGLTNSTTYYYSAFGYDAVPNLAPPATTTGVPTGPVCFTESFPYPNAGLNGNGGWSGTAAAQIAVENQYVRISGGAGSVQADKPVVCGQGATIGISARVKKGSGSAGIWSLWIDDPQAKNLARWYGTGISVRGRVGTGAPASVATLTGGWDDLYIAIDFAANQSRFYFNGSAVGTLSQSGTGAGDSIGRVRLERIDTPTAVNDYVCIDDLLVGVADTSAPVASVSSPSLSITRSGPVSYAVSFSEPVFGFSSGSDVQLNPTGTASAASVSVAGSGAGPYTVTLSDLTGDGTLGVTVKAGACTDAAGNSSAAGSASTSFRVLGSDGSISAAKLLPDDSPLSLGNKALYLKWPGFGYIEEPARTNGIRVEGSMPAGEDELVCLIGTMKTRPGGERFVLLSALSPAGSGLVRPVGANNRALASMCGMHVKTWGLVKPGSIAANSYVITDGSGDAGIRVITQGAPGVSDGQFVLVTGAAGFEGGSRVVYQR